MPLVSLEANYDPSNRFGQSTDTDMADITVEEAVLRLPAELRLRIFIFQAEEPAIIFDDRPHGVIDARGPEFIKL